VTDPEGTPATETETGTADFSATTTVTVKKNTVTPASIVTNNIPAAPDAPGDEYTDSTSVVDKFLFTVTPAETTTTQYMIAFSSQTDADNVSDWEDYPAGGLTTESAPSHRAVRR
jgi:hypothetical protein